MAVNELSEYLEQDKKEMDADVIAPYICLVIAETATFVYKEIIAARKEKLQK